MTNVPSQKTAQTLYSPHVTNSRQSSPEFSGIFSAGEVDPVVRKIIVINGAIAESSIR